MRPARALSVVAGALAGIARRAFTHLRRPELGAVLVVAVQAVLALVLRGQGGHAHPHGHAGRDRGDSQTAAGGIVAVAIGLDEPDAAVDVLAGLGAQEGRTTVDG